MPKKVVDARADKDGNITAVRFDGNSTFTPVETAIRMAQRGDVANAHAVRQANGGHYLRSNPDGSESNNLDVIARDK